MTEPTNELMMKIMISLREDVVSLREDMASFRAECLDRFDLITERVRQLETTTHEGFAAHRRAASLGRSVAGGRP